jgi:hypothetical protein
MERGGKIKSSFLIFLGEKDGNRINAIVNLMNSKGKCVQIMDRTYVLEIESEEVISTRELRDYLNNSKDYFMIVINLDYGIAAAWRLREDKSNYLKSVFDDIYSKE